MQPITFQLPHLTLRGLTNGNEQAPVLLCLHGWLDNAASFEPLSQYLSKYHVIAIEIWQVMVILIIAVRMLIIILLIG